MAKICGRAARGDDVGRERFAVLNVIDGHYHIRDLLRVRHTHDFTTDSTIATSLVNCRLDYCKSLYHELPLMPIKRLQKIQN